MRDDGFLRRYIEPPPEKKPEPTWHWRNCRDAQVSMHLHLLPSSWRFRLWWEPEVFTLAAGIHLWLVSIHLWCSIGDASDGTWRSKFSLSELQAWRQAGGK